MKGAVAKGRDRIQALTQEASERVEQAREAVPPVDIAITAWERDGRMNGFVIAGAIAFRMFVYLLPLYLLVLVIAGAALSISPESPEDLASSAGMSQYLAGTIGNAANTSNKSLWIMVPLTLYALLSAGRSAHKVMVTAHASAWGLPPRKGATSFKTSVAFFLFAVLTLATASVVRQLRGNLTVLSFVLAGAAYFGLWMLASRWLPRAEGATLRDLMPGALFVAVGTQALYAFSVLYLNQKIQSASQAYGALGIAGSVLLWLYLVGRLVVAAPVLNATMWERNHPELPAPPVDSTA